MRKSYIMGGLTSAVLFAAAEASAAAGSGEAATKKSIVPAKYSGKYKGAGDGLAEFITKECTGKEGFEFTAFFALARKNGIAEDKVAHYEAQVLEEKRAGSAGRARMTLGNMLRSKARKGPLVSLNDEEVTIEGLAKPAVSGAAASAQEAAASAETESTAAATEETATDEDTADETTE